MTAPAPCIQFLATPHQFTQGLNLNSWNFDETWQTRYVQQMMPEPKFQLDPFSGSRDMDAYYDSVIFCTASQNHDVKNPSTTLINVLISVKPTPL